MIPPYYLPYLDTERYTTEEIFAFFRDSPESLATFYIKGEKISAFHRSRIVHEGTYETFTYLLHQMGNADALVVDLAEHLGISLQIEQILL
jgi:hypothetical protein